MKRISITYNPYTVSSRFLIDGKAPKVDSRLNVGKTRIQEWAEYLPEWLRTEFNEKSFAIKFIGTDSDFEDLKAGFENNQAGVLVNFSFVRKPDIDEVEKSIDEVFNDIQRGPITELKSKAITDAFQRAKNAQFEINVVATMSSGKSTLINALLGKHIMPSANEATTATIVKVHDNDDETGDDFYATGYDANGKKVFDRKRVSLEDMQNYNRDEQVSLIEMEGSIPFVDATSMKLVLVDTPGPNNARNKHHEEMTYKMMADSEKSLVLVVLNAEQSGVGDEQLFLNYICYCMKSGGKQTRDRFMFVVNKVNCFDPSEGKDGPGCIARVLTNIKKDLEDRGIPNPNIFPVAALPALEKRICDRRKKSLYPFTQDALDFPEMQFDRYYDFSHLPYSSRLFVEDCKSQSNEDDVIEIYTGIFNLEQAISLYINKYARNTKVMNLVLAFNSTLEELAAIANLEETIRNDKDAEQKLKKQIASIRKNIKDARNAKTYSSKIDNFDVTITIRKDIQKITSGVRTQINQMLAGRETRVEVSLAEVQCEELTKQVSTLRSQIKAKVEDTIIRNFTDSISKMIGYYQQYLEDLDVKFDEKVLNISPLQIICSQVGNIQDIMRDASNTETISEVQTEAGRKLTVKENKKENAQIGAIMGGLVGLLAVPFVGAAALVGAGVGGILGHLFTARGLDETKEKLITKDTTYVNMSDVVIKYLQPLQKDLLLIEENVVQYVKDETLRIKSALKEKFEEIDAILDMRLTELEKVQKIEALKVSEIAEKQKKLKWLTNIEKRINDIVNF